jgi:hypothetical protein
LGDAVAAAWLCSDAGFAGRVAGASVILLGARGRTGGRRRSASFRRAGAGSVRLMVLCGGCLLSCVGRVCICSWRVGRRRVL